jgi:DNA processing protein
MATAALTQEETLHWLALRMVPGLGTVGTLRLLEKLKSPQAIFRSSADELEGAGVSPAQARNIASGCSFDDAVDQQQKALSAGAQLITFQDPRYPQALREIFDPPVLLFALGRIELMTGPGIAVVGTRRPTPYGMAAAERLSADLARAGLTIISGMARGIDSCAHKAALAEAGDTIAVFGCGVDVLYPVENRKLYQEIARLACARECPEKRSGCHAWAGTIRQWGARRGWDRTAACGTACRRGRCPKRAPG